MENTKNKELSDLERQVHQLIGATMKDVAKIEADIKKLPARGVLQLNYEPNGDVPNRQPKEISRDIRKLRDVIESLKASALGKTDDIIAELPSTQQKIIRQWAEEKLFPDMRKEDKPLPVKEKNSQPLVSRFLQYHPGKHDNKQPSLNKDDK